uniref:Putative trypsin-like serine protease n=2 Tax=Ixodes ricinus TaxID=34613 RepID=V5GGY3_IXORI
MLPNNSRKKMILRDLALTTIASILLGVAYMEHTGYNDFLQKVRCGRRHLRNTVSERIVNGTVAKTYSWPWMVGLYNENDNLVLRRTFLNKTTYSVLTAAHCFANKNASFLSARLGSTNKTRSTDCSDERSRRDAAKQSDTTESDATPNAKVICVGVEEVCIPVQDDCNFFMQDIAVLRLERPVNFTNLIQPICLPENCVEPPLDVPTYIAGWGKIEVVQEDEDYESYEYEDYEQPEEEGDEKSSAEERISGNSPSRRALSTKDAHTNTLRERQICLISNEECKHQLKRTVPDYTLCSTGGTCSRHHALMTEANGLRTCRRHPSCGTKLRQTATQLARRAHLQLRRVLVHQVCQQKAAAMLPPIFQQVTQVFKYYSILLFECGIYYNKAPPVSFSSASNFKQINGLFT